MNEAVKLFQPESTVVTNPNIPDDWEEFARQIHIRSGLEMVPFIPYDYQVELNRVIDSHRGVVITKTRQMGLTEFIAAKFLHKAAKFPGYLALVFSKNQKDTRNIARRIRSMANAHPHILLDGSSLEDLSLTNGGRIVFLTSTPNAGRGYESVSDILYDECGFVDAIAEIYGATSPSQKMVGAKAKTILLSTPNGQSGFYWEQLNKGNGDRNLLEVCRQIREGEAPPMQWWTSKNGWAKFVVHYKAHPVYSQSPNFLQSIKEEDNLTEAQVQREYNLGFDESGGHVFKGNLINRATRGEWRSPQWARVYLAGIDPSFGGEDYFTVRIWDVTEPPYPLVAQFRRNNHGKDYYIEKSIELLDQYAPALIAVETNTGGTLYLQEFVKQRPHWQMEAINSTNPAKILHSDRLVLLLERDQLIFPVEPEEVLERDELCEQVSSAEYRHYIESIDGSTRKREAESAYHDDTVAADYVAFAVLDKVQVHQYYGAGGADGRSVQAIASEL